MKDSVGYAPRGSDRRCQDGTGRGVRTKELFSFPAIDRGHMFKAIVLGKKKAGLTLEQFKAHYESTHAPLTVR